LAEELKAFQGGDEMECPICGEPATVLDGSYKTGKPRGYLCSRHNIALGWFKDSIPHLKAAIKYLNNPPAKRMRKVVAR
jgi:hypothetical protein